MKFTLETGDAAHRIRGYGPGHVTVNDERIACSVVVMPERLMRDWPPQRFEDLARAHFEQLLNLAPEIVLLGTGPQLRFPHPEHTAPLAEAGIGLEVMDTSAACRTYNVLMAEGRLVAAALLMI